MTLLPPDELDQRYPLDAQTSALRRRWDLCVGIAEQQTGEPRGSAQNTAFARALFIDESIPTDPLPEGMEIQESELFDFENMHPRDRMGRWRDIRGRAPGKPKQLKGLGRAPASPGTTLERIRELGLDDWPEPGEQTKKVLGDFATTADKWMANRPASPGTDSPVHAPYKAQRRKRHDRIVGRWLAGPIGDLLGPDHAIVAKLGRGGRLSEAEKQTVRDAATSARAGSPPDALFMAGGPASGKTTVLENNPELAPPNSLHIDSDKLKAELSEYQELRAANDHYAATAVHRESGDLAARLAHEAGDLRLNIVMDGTGNSERGAFKRDLLGKKNEGYDVMVLYATTGTDEAVARAVDRAEETGRFVPVPVVREQHAFVSQNFEDVEKLDWLVSLDVFDDSGHIGTMHDGEFHDIDSRAMAAFRAKAKEGQHG